MNRCLILLLLVGCAGNATPLEAKDTRDSRLDVVDTDNDGEWAYIVIDADRDYDQVAPITGGSHNPKEMPPGNTGTPEPETQESVPEKIKIKKCGADADCPSKACLRPTGGPHPYGVCGEAVDHLGRPTPNRIVHSCGIHLACPGGAKCVLAYEDYGMCFK
jgi:hypothetical protein